MARYVRSAAMVAALAGLAAGSAFADGFVFSNDCGTGLWGSLCNNAGTFRNNWGRSGPGPSIPFPGAADTAQITIGTVVMDVSPTLAALTLAPATGLDWRSGSLNVGAMSNSGVVMLGTGANKFFGGTAVNNSQSGWWVTTGALYYTGGAITNNGEMYLADGGAIRRSGSALAGCVLENSGLVRVATGHAGTISNIAVRGTPAGVWRTDTGGALTLDGVGMEGVIRGHYMGTCTLTGGCTLLGNTTLVGEIGSGPLQWTNATLDTGAFTLTNAGPLQLLTGANKFLTGAVVNAGPLSVDEGNLYLAPGAAPTTITNTGTMTIGAAAMRRNGGSRSGAVLSNSGSVRATQPGASISNLTLVGVTGSWHADPGTSLEFNDVSLGGSFTGMYYGPAFFTGSVTLSGDATLRTAGAGANPWGWTTAAFDTGPFTLTNEGALTLSGGSNKFFTGNAVNVPGAAWALAEGNMYLVPSSPTTLTNNGTVSFTGAAGLLRNGGNIENARLVNNGAVTSSAMGASIQNVSLVSNGGVWRTAGGASLTLSSTRLSGSFMGDHGGALNLEGSMVLSGDASFSTLPTSVAPWRWTNAAIDANGFTLTSAGRLETVTGANKFLTGTLINAANAEIVCTDGALYLTPGGGSGSASLTNQGTLRLDNGRAIARNGGSVAAAVLTNNALLHVTGSGSAVDNLTVVNGPSGVVRVNGGASLQVPPDWSLTGGRLEGSGQVTAAGATGLQNVGGTLAPGMGATTGTLLCGGRYTQGPGGALEISVVSDGVTQSADKLRLTSAGFFGQATLGGTLRVNLPAGVTPAPTGNTDYVIVDAPGGLSGAFASVVDADPITGYRYQVTYTPTQAIMRVIKRCNGADFAGTGADANFDGRLDNNDFVVFIDLFFAQDPQADVGSTGGLRGSDGEFNNNDFVVFIDVFFEGCH